MFNFLARILPFFSLSVSSRFLALFCLCFALFACMHSPETTYDALGGAKKIEEIVDNFIAEIEFDKVIYTYFKESDIERFRDKLIEQLCDETGGPCAYTGDSMVDVHTKMNINESDFNRAVDLLINAMNKADVPHKLQNEVLATLVPMRSDIIYR